MGSDQAELHNPLLKKKFFRNSLKTAFSGPIFATKMGLLRDFINYSIATNNQNAPSFTGDVGCPQKKY